YYWYTQDKSVITGFQMIYSVNDAKMALTFETGKKLKIHAIESDDRMVSHSPILNGKGIFLPQQIRKEFEERSSNIEPQLIEYVLDVLKDC
ncbi:MAG: hypothetical protein PF447_04715, partial [Spirochaetaceae bacterium]|nr:hypothetical protein [Spirochaetaceae bacterium]